MSLRREFTVCRAGSVDVGSVEVSGSRLEARVTLWLSPLLVQSRSYNDKMKQPKAMMGQNSGSTAVFDTG